MKNISLKIYSVICSYNMQRKIYIDIYKFGVENHHKVEQMSV